MSMSWTWRGRRPCRLALFFALIASELPVASTAAPLQGGALTLHPISLRNRTDRYLMPAVGAREPYYVLKSDANAPEMKRIWSLALDYGGTPVLGEVDPRDPRRLVALGLAVPEDQLRRGPCRDAPRLTREFWRGKAPMANPKTDQILWIAREPGCRVSWIHFQEHEGRYYLDDRHPAAEDMLRRARESVDLERTVRWSRCEGVFDSVCALDLAADRQAPMRGAHPQADPDAFWLAREEVWGALERLSPSEARFVAYWRTIRDSAETQGAPFQELTHQAREQERTTGALTVSGQTLRLIEGYSVTLDPRSTGALEVSFYRSDEEYFYRQVGGCIEESRSPVRAVPRRRLRLQGDR